MTTEHTVRCDWSTCRTERRTGGHAGGLARDPAEGWWSYQAWPAADASKATRRSYDLCPAHGAILWGELGPVPDGRGTD